MRSKSHRSLLVEGALPTNPIAAVARKAQQHSPDCRINLAELLPANVLNVRSIDPGLLNIHLRPPPEPALMLVLLCRWCIAGTPAAPSSMLPLLLRLLPLRMLNMLRRRRVNDGVADSGSSGGTMKVA
mgnify:CR=1 FL=1